MKSRSPILLHVQLKSQLAAWASAQSTVVQSREQLETQFLETEQRFKEQDIPLPPTWGGYRIIPEVVEFWQGRRSRLHDRVQYSLQKNTSWMIERLSP